MMRGPAGVIYKHFEEVSDPPVNRGVKHDLVEMIFMALNATICGARAHSADPWMPEPGSSA